MIQALRHPLIAPARPFIKWAGGKTQLLQQLTEHLPLDLSTGKITRYAEPFVGGGALFFHLAQEIRLREVVLCDANRDLFVCYVTIQKDVSRLCKRLHAWQKAFLTRDDEGRKHLYYAVRAELNWGIETFNFNLYSDEWVERAAQLLLLNRTCYNGLYRVNASGRFNVPYGRYRQPRIVDSENLWRVSSILRRAEILVGDFTCVDRFVDDRTFVYFDPPYRPLSATANFTAYAAERFAVADQKRLADFFLKLHERGARLMLSNSDPKNEDPADDFFERHYGQFRIQRLTANRMINSNAKKRGKISELLITNY